MMRQRRLRAAHSSRYRMVTGILLAIVLHGCASTQRTEEAGVTDWPAHRTMLHTLEDWQLDGRIGLTAAGDGWSGSLSWHQALEEVDFRFRGPLGIGGFRIHGNRDQLRVKTSGGEEFWLTDPEAELQAEFGWTVPIHSMRYWLLGAPDPDGEDPEEVFGPDGTLATLEQDGWIVEFDRYRQWSGVRLPGKVVIVGEDVRIRVAVDRWTLEP